MEKGNVLFSTCGWQFSNITANDSKLLKGSHNYDIVGLGADPDMPHNILWSTDGGVFASNPRLYYLKSKVEAKLADTFAMLHITLGLAVVDELKIDINTSSRGMGQFYDDAKYTISSHKDYFLLTHTFYEDECHEVAQYYNTKPLPLKVFYVLDKNDYHIVSYSLSHEAEKAVDMCVYKSNGFSLGRLNSMSHAVAEVIKSWKKLSEEKGIGFDYLEVVVGNCEIYLDGVKHILGENLTYFSDVFSPYYAYCGVTQIRPETGFNTDEAGQGDMHGKTAMCIVL